MRELSIVELAAESAVVLPSRSLLRHHRSSSKSITQQMNNSALANSSGIASRAIALNISALNTQNVQSFKLA